MVLVSLPSFSTSTTTLSPDLSQGLLGSPMATPAGVPVVISSPGSSLKYWLQLLTICATEKIMSDVFSFWRISPLTVVVTCNDWGSPTSSAETSTGPLGKNLSGVLPSNHWLVRVCRSRTLRSLAVQ